MEFASYLAGERWSDHPACTHPLLGLLARKVNDHISDEARQGLIGLVPDVIGLAGSDLRIDARIALRAARTALPVVAAKRQRVMAVGVLTSERVIADLDGCPDAPISEQSRDALARSPGAAAWAQSYTRDIAISRRTFRRQTAPAIVGYAVHGIAQVCPDRDRVLHDLLVGAIEDCRRWCTLGESRLAALPRADELGPRTRASAATDATQDDRGNPPGLSGRSEWLGRHLDNGPPAAGSPPISPVTVSSRSAAHTASGVQGTSRWTPAG